jgi:hypothetical protein
MGSSNTQPLEVDIQIRVSGIKKYDPSDGSPAVEAETTDAAESNIILGTSAAILKQRTVLYFERIPSPP